MPPMLVCCTHKSGTVLFERVMRRAGERLGFPVAVRYGVLPLEALGEGATIAAHSLLAGAAPPGVRVLRVVRDPRDIWVSGYLYHLHCREGWCVNADLSPTAPIGWPKVDFSVMHRSEAWKRGYLAGLRGRSYQENLRARDQVAGLDFELANYTRWTLQAMAEWAWEGPEVLTVKLEDLSADYDGTMAALARHFGLDVGAMVEAAAPEDLGRMSDAAVAGDPHIHGRKLSKWRDVLSPAQVAAFTRQYGDLLVRLGYAANG